MKILFLTFYFQPDLCAGSYRNTPLVENSKKNEKVLIPSDTNYSSIKGLSNEVVEKLIKHKPSTLGQASRLEGVTPAATNLIAISIKKKQLLEKA